MTWTLAFAITLALEAPIYVLGTRGQGLTPLVRLAAAVGTSAATHPIVWFVLPPLLIPTAGWFVYFAVAETFAVVAEALYVRALGVQAPWRLSLLANAASATTGLVVHALW